MQGAEVLHQFLHVAGAGARFRRLVQRGRTGARRCDDQENDAHRTSSARRRPSTIVGPHAVNRGPLRVQRAARRFV
ncbi:hypothetical protein BURMUCF2_B0073 [Burkholderia multivorans CF2]|nr:hypothetical protein BURMUCF2_B0073 [Burkholderia multivorans CF2]